MPSLLQDLDIFDTEPAGSPYQKFQDRAADTLKKAYKAVRLQQDKISSANRTAINARRGAGRKSGEPAALVQFNVGDLVLFWEPAQPKIMQTVLQRLTHITTTKAPSKWTDTWTGPHEITAKTPDMTGYRYKLYHRGRGVEIDTHVNKLDRYLPWSEGIMSTSADLDTKSLYKSGSWVENGSLVLVPLVEPYPFGIARLLECEEGGDMRLQWLGNPTDSTGGTYELGWKASGGANSRPYYEAHARRATHQPYTTEMDGLTMNQRDVLIHGFELTAGGRLPAPLLRAIARHPYVWWDPLAIKKDAAPTTDTAVARPSTGKRSRPDDTTTTTASQQGRRAHGRSLRERR